MQHHNSSSDQEFYIGWQASAPAGFALWIRRFVMGLCLLVPAVALLIVGFQSSFSGGVFEFGKKIVLEGRLKLQPVPMLVLDNGETTDGRAISQEILLLSPGKFGAEKKLFENPSGIPVEGQRLRAEGYLIYHDGKTAFEIASWQAIGQPSVEPFHSQHTDLGAVTLCGELTDPKCLFGVMKPGYGQPHRDCATRCIAGGIPPVLKVSGNSGETEYYLLAGPNGERLNETLLPYVADGIRLSGRLEQDGDWLVLYADPARIERVNSVLLGPGIHCN